MVDLLGMRGLSLLAVLLGLMLVPASFGLAKIQGDNERQALDRTLAHQASEEGEALEAYFERSRGTCARRRTPIT